MVKVYTSSVIDAPADKVWGHVRDFNGLPRWVPAVADSRIENGLPADRVGCIRNFNLRDGGNLREQLLALPVEIDRPDDDRHRAIASRSSASPRRRR